MAAKKEQGEGLVTYLILRPIVHDNKYRPIGSTIELASGEARPYLADKAVCVYTPKNAE